MMRYFFLCSLSLLIAACGSDATEQADRYETEVDLMSYNLPFKVYAPEGFSIEAQDDILDDVVIKGPEYHVQIYGTAAMQGQRKAFKEEKLAQLKTEEDFKRLVLDEDFGFVYETQMEGEKESRYNFFYVLKQGDKNYTFQSTTNFDAFGEAAILKMYASIKQE